MKSKIKVTVLALAITSLMATAAFAATEEAPILKERLLGRIGGFKGQHLMLEKTGLTREQVTEAINSGKTFEEIAKELNVDLEALKNKMPRNKGIGQMGNFSVHQQLLEKTGLSRAEFVNLIKDGKTIEDIAKENNIDLEALKNEMLEKKLALIDENILQNKLTAEEGAQLKERIKENFENCENGFRGMMGGNRNNKMFNKIKSSTDFQ